MPLPRRTLLLKRSPHNPERPEQWFSRLSVPRLLSGRPGSKDIHKGFLSSGIVNFVNQCFGLLYFVDSTGVGPSVVWNPSTDEERSVPPPGADVLRSPEECGTMRRLEIGMPLTLYKNGDELLMFMSNSNGQLMVYSSASQELKLLPLFSHRGALQLISYHQTSISLD